MIDLGSLTLGMALGGILVGALLIAAELLTESRVPRLRARGRVQER